MKLKLSVMQIFICLALVALVGVVSIAFVAATTIRDTMIEDRQDKVKQITLGVYSTIEKTLARKKAGEITDEQANNLVFNAIQDFRYDGKNYVFAIRYDSCVFSHYVAKLIGDCKPGKLRDDLASTAKTGGDFYRYKTRKAGFEGEDFDKVSYVHPVDEMDMYIGSGVYFDDINEVYLQRLLELSVIGAIIVLVILGVGIYVGKAISGSIRTVSTSMERLSTGNFDIEFDFDNFIKEIGFIFRSLDVFQKELQRKNELEGEKSGLATKAEEDRKKAALELADQFDRTVGRIVQNVSSAASEMEQTATGMTHIAAKTTDRAVDVSTAAKEANENSSAVASATEELSTSIAEIGSQVQRASQVANQAVEESQSANERVSGLVAAADKVGEVVTLITDIANQTNLLALNATIEAARAGEMGKGFAVVASEVKNLASQTAQATEEIATQVATIQKETQASVSAIENIGSTINDINAISSTIAAAVEEQGVATEEISRNIREVSSGTSSVTENISSVQASSDESRSSAETVKEAANQLTVQSNLLSDEVDGFLKEIRSR